MRLRAVLSLDRVRAQADVADRGRLLALLADLLVAGGDGRRRDEIVRAFVAREALASTAIGEGVAIPHARVPDVDELRAAVVVTRRGVDFDAEDRDPVRIFVAFLAPDRHTGDHLRALARATRLLRDARARARLLAASDDTVLHEAVLEEDDRH